MSEFWEKNKGSITSGLKTAGKYGYQGSKFVAKTGYQAGKKNFNSKKKNEQGKKDPKDEEDEEMDERSQGRGNGGNYRDPAGYPARYPPYQQQPPYQQPQYQQPQPQYQQPQPQYQQPQPQYQQPQPQYQQPQFQQPQYQQPQYQQPQYQQPQYQQPQYQQPQYQQPQYQQPQIQQSQLQQPQYQQPQLQQPQYPQQQTPGQYQPQPPPQYEQPPTPAVVPQHSATPPQPPQRAPVASLPPQTPQSGPAVGYPPTAQAQGVALPGMTSSPGAPIQMISPTPLQPSEMQSYGVNPSSGDLSGAASSQPSMLSSEHIPQASAPVQGVTPSGYGRARLASPPLSTREAFPLPASAASTGGNSGSVPGVTPFDPDAPKEVRRLPTPAVDVTALPPPPKHRDRGSALNLPAAATAPTRVSGQAERRAPSRVATSELDPTTLNQVAPTPLPATSVPQAALDSAIEASAIEASAEEISEPMEEAKLGIAGRFNYDVNVGYAPPPKPHRNSSKAASRPLAHKTAAPLPKRSSTDSLHPEAPPALPGRHLSSETVRSNVSGETANPSFQPPPKPFRRSEPSLSGHPTPTSAAEKVLTDTMPTPVDLSSFPPPPVQRWQSHRSTTSRAESIIEDTDEPRKPTPRGRIPVDVQQGENGESETDEPLHRKKEAPPVVKPKPISLSIQDSEHSNASEVSAISNELATFKLKKTGSGYLGEESRVSNSQSKRSSPPVVPQKKEPLKHAPPVPPKSSSLKVAEGHTGRQGKNNELNPFEHYLKSAVPTENNRLHR